MKRTLTIVMLLLGAVLTAYAQHQVTGRVTDRNGEPLIGVGVTVSDSPTPIGTTTDKEGRYSLSVSPDAVLQFSSLGYRTVEVPVNGRGGYQHNS